MAIDHCMRPDAAEWHVACAIVSTEAILFDQSVAVAVTLCFGRGVQRYLFG
jgi:hypothetical protein